MLVLSLVLAAAAARPAATPAAPPAKKTAVRRVVVTKLPEGMLRVGSRATIEGIGFSQGTVLLLNTFAPKIFERTDTRIVFEVPFDPTQREGYHTPVLLVTPGQLVLSTKDVFVEWRGPAPAPSRGTAPPKVEAPKPLVETSVTITSEKPGVVRFAPGKVAANAVTVGCTGGEARVEARPAGKGEPMLAMATQAGKLRWVVNHRFLGASEESPLEGVELTLTTEAITPVPCRVVVASGN